MRSSCLERAGDSPRRESWLAERWLKACDGALLMNLSLRQLVLALVFIGVVGLEIELALLRHADSFSQLIPHIVLLIGLVATIIVYLRPSAATLRAFQAIMWLFVAIGLLGVFFHLKGNLEFATERDPSLSGLK